MDSLSVDLRSLVDELPAPEPGEECYACHRPVPKVKKDDRTGPIRSTVTIREPRGEEGVLDDLMIQVVDKYQDEWPRDHAAMRAGLGLEVVGGRAWKYYVVQWCLYMALTLDVKPSEEGP